MSDTPKQPEVADRLAKVIARAGLCSRRDAEGWIADGRITVNGKKVLTPAFNVTSRDKIEVDGLPLAARQGTRIWLYHKPAGLVVTEKDPEGRPPFLKRWIAWVCRVSSLWVASTSIPKACCCLPMTVG